MPLSLANIPFQSQVLDTPAGRKKSYATIHFTQTPQSVTAYAGFEYIGTPLRWAKPLTPSDGENGQVCASGSGWWFPAHMLVWVDGKPYGYPFAPIAAVPPDLDLLQSAEYTPPAEWDA